MIAIQIIRFMCPKTSSRKSDRDVAEEGDVHLRDARDVGRRSFLPVDVDEEVAGEPDREKVDRRAADDLVGAQVDREDGVQQRHQPAGEDADDQPEPPRVELVGAARMAKKAPISIIPSRPMLTTPERSLNMPPSAPKMSGVA